MTKDPTERLRVRSLLEGLASERREETWKSFLLDYSALIYHVVSLLDSDPDNRGDSFLFICQHLQRDEFRRLRQFQADGSASFATWLRAVVRNLYLDWRRKKFGRRRNFRALLQLNSLQRKVYRCVFEEQMSTRSTFQTLQSRFMGLTERNVEEALDQIYKMLPSSRLVGGGSRQPAPLSLDHRDSSTGLSLADRLADAVPDPETAIVAAERTSQLENALGKLTDSERQIIELRFRDELTLEQISLVIGLGSPQSARYRLQQAVSKLKSHMT